MIERRAITATEFRAAGRRLEGYAATFGAEARLPGFTEIVAPGAFASSLKAGGDILALVDHDATKVLARTKSGTLKLSEDSKGLAFSFDVPATQAGNDVLALAQTGDLGGMSFAFTVPKNGERWNGTRRELRSVNLLEISVVSAWPAYPETSVIARARPPLRLAMAMRFLETC
jgi:Escherichia/Staphylococcus phage prohead protease